MQTKPQMMRTTVYINSDLWRLFHKKCIDDDTNMTQLINSKIEEYIKEDETYKKELDQIYRIKTYGLV